MNEPEQLSSTGVDYLAYLRSVRRIFAAACISSAFYAVLYAARVVVDFRTSRADGLNTLEIGLFGTLGLLVLTALFLAAVGIPQLIRSAVLRRRFPDVALFVVKRIPGYWDRLEAVNVRHSTSSPMQNSTLTVGGGSATLWRGVFHPKRIAELPMSELVRIETDRVGTTAFRRRIVVLTFDVDGRAIELPIALRTVSSLGYWRLSPAALAEACEKLAALSNTSDR